jgi:hypothetical protein
VFLGHPVYEHWSFVEKNMKLYGVAVTKCQHIEWGVRGMQESLPQKIYIV